MRKCAELQLTMASTASLATMIVHEDVVNVLDQDDDESTDDNSDAGFDNELFEWIQRNNLPTAVITALMREKYTLTTFRYLSESDIDEVIAHLLKDKKVKRAFSRPQQI